MAVDRWWKSWPAISGLAGVMALLVGVGAWLFPVDKQAGGGPATAVSAESATPEGPPSAALSSSPTASPEASADATPGSSASPDKVRWSDEVRFDDDGIDFDTVPPTVEMTWSAFDSDLRRGLSGPDRPLTAENGRIALWPGTDTPTRQQCADRISTHGDERVHIPVGRTGCLRTSKDRIVMLTVTGFPVDSFEVTARATVWDTPEGD